jgi:hypothetical protein
MMSVTKTSIAGNVLAGGTTNTGDLTFKRPVARWSASVRRWWLDYCTHEGLRGAEAHILLEAGFHRTATGRLARIVGPGKDLLKA